MKKKEQFFEIMGKIDPQLIVDAAPDKVQRKTTIWMKWGVAAACLCFVLVGIITVSPMLSPHNLPITPPDIANDFSQTDSTQESNNPPANDTADTNNGEDTDETIPDPETYYSISFSADYVWTSEKDLFENSDVVLIGNYKDTINTHYERSRFITTGCIDIERIIKGSVDSNNISIDYYGGKMSVSEFISVTGKNVAKQYISDDLSDPIVTERYIGELTTGASVNAQTSHKYLIFLSYDPNTSQYFVMADGYGMRKINDEGKAWDIDSQSYVDIEILK